MIPLTRPYLPQPERFEEYCREIWANGWLTNDGPLVGRLEERLCAYLKQPYVVLTVNGTLALQLALRVLAPERGSVVTTPFSFVATASAPRWEGYRPKFADIDAGTLCLDPTAASQQIDADTVAVLATHVYGRACNIEALGELATGHGLPLIYDAAHAFGVDYRGSSLLDWGDAAVLSFHATKVFHSAEGGAIIVRTPEVRDKLRAMLNFGIPGPDQVAALGINAKMNELSAAMGLAVLDDVDQVIAARRRICERYRANLPESMLLRPMTDVTENGGYFPVLFPSTDVLLGVKDALSEYEITTRRYFFPSLDTLDFLCAAGQAPCPVSRDISSRILCLPVYPELPADVQETVIAVVRSAIP